MSVEQTLSIIKPDGVQKDLIGEIYRRFEKAGLSIVAARMMHLSKAQADTLAASIQVIADPVRCRFCNRYCHVIRDPSIASWPAWFPSLARLGRWQEPTRK